MKDRCCRINLFDQFFDIYQTYQECICYTKKLIKKELTKKEEMNINQLNINDLQDIRKYMFSIANGNYILRYSEVEYRDFLAASPSVIIDLLTIYFVSSNWGFEQQYKTLIKPDHHIT